MTVSIPDSALAAIEDHIRQVQLALGSSQTPEACAMIADDLRSHACDRWISLAHSMAESGPGVSDDQVTERLLAELDPPSSYAANPTLEQPFQAGSSDSDSYLESDSAPLNLPVRRTMFHVAFGIWVPVIALGAELATQTAYHFTGARLIPDHLSVGMVAFVPIAMTLALLFGNFSQPKFIGFLLASFLAVAAGISLGYTFRLLPLMLVGAMFFWLVLPLLSFAPFLSLISSLQVLRSYWRYFRFSRIAQLALIGMAVIGLGCSTFHPLTQNLLESELLKILSEDPDERQSALKWAGMLGGAKALRKVVNGRDDSQSFFLGGPRMTGRKVRLSTSDARKAYFLLTGEDARSEAESLDPDNPWMDARSQRMAENRDERIGELNTQLKLSSSRLDGYVDNQRGVAYLEWTLNVHNSGSDFAEGRMLMMLPEGSVPSRLTLWVQGEEREAAFAARGKVRQAYESVVAARQDPVLATLAGPGRLMVKCFPVLPDATMKFRVGLTCPLPPGSDVPLELPWISSANLRIPEGSDHSFWLDGPSLVATNPKWKSGTEGARGPYLQAQLSGSDIQSAHRIQVAEVQSTATLNLHPILTRDQAAVLQRVADQPALAKSHAILVLNTSRAMAPVLPELSRAIAAIPSRWTLDLIITTDGAPVVLEKVTPAAAADEVLRQTVTGGRDSLPALVRAWDLAAERGTSTPIVWLHPGQPVMITPPEHLEQRTERTGRTVRILEIQHGNLPDELLREMDRSIAFERAPGAGTAAERLSSLFRTWDQGGPPRWARERIGPDLQNTLPYAMTEDPQTSGSAAGHVARLWAAEETLRLYRSPGWQAATSATALAAQFQLVTAPTGAVVLETQQQYQAAGLQPVDPNTVPTVPEPGEWILGILALALVWWMMVRRNRHHRSTAA